MNKIKVDLERAVGKVDRNIFGGYLELAQALHNIDTVYSPKSPLADVDGLRSDVKAAVKRMRLSNIRYPGGNMLSGYRWKDGIGPLENRPTRHDLAWNTIEPNHFGTNEFISFCRKLRAEPCICVNCGDGDMREAADWVEYCNGTGEVAMAKLRREHGFDKPHNVKYWGIGNEVDAPFQIGYKTPQEYARVFTEFAKVMKWVDQNIKLIASAVSVWEDTTEVISGELEGPRPGFEIPIAGKIWESRWVERAQLLLEEAGNLVDYMAFHYYARPHDNNSFEATMTFAEKLEERLNAYEGLIKAIRLEKRIINPIYIAVDEWGLIRRPRLKGRAFNLEDALISAMHLNAFIRHASSVRMANSTSSFELIKLDSMHPDSMVLQTIFYPFEAYSQSCGQLALDVYWEGDTFGSDEYTGLRILDVAATLNNTGKQLTIYVINRGQKENVETVISLTTGHFEGNIQVSLVNGPDVKAENTFDSPNQVVTRKTSFKATGKSLTYSFEPHSVTALICAVS